LADTIGGAGLGGRMSPEAGGNGEILRRRRLDFNRACLVHRDKYVRSPASIDGAGRIRPAARPFCLTLCTA